jgi:hypothetical protein
MSEGVIAQLPKSRKILERDSRQPSTKRETRLTDPLNTARDNQTR